MKRILLAITVVILTAIIIIQFFRNSLFDFFEKTIVETPTIADISPTLSDESHPDTHSVTVSGKQYAYVLIVVKPASVRLIENTGMDESSDLAKKNNCSLYVNGGYYTSSNNPLGLFVIDGVKKYPQHLSATLNGFVAINQDNNPTITDSIPSGNLRLALQAGPVIYENGHPLSLSISNDNPERRVLVAVTDEHKLLFLAVFDQRSVYLGPTLTLLPQVLDAILSKEHLKVNAALNLDGGTASVFRTDAVYLSEYKPVGSIFCIQ